MIITQHIAERLKNALTACGLGCGHGVGRLIEKDKNLIVAIKDGKKGEMSYIGIDDRKENYYYLRYTNTKTRFAPAKKKGSCNGCKYTAIVPIVAVAVFRCADAGALEQKLLMCLCSTPFGSEISEYKPTNICIKLTSSSSDFENILFEETGKKGKNLVGLQLAKVEFELTYDFDFGDCSTVENIELC